MVGFSFNRFSLVSADDEFHLAEQQLNLPNISNKSVKHVNTDGCGGCNLKQLDQKTLESETEIKSETPQRVVA